MRLPAEYPEIVAAGVATLRAVGAAVRAVVTRRADVPELWLTVRDFEGLAERLAALNDWDWQNGFGDMFITGQDLGALDELLQQGVRLHGSSLVSLTPEQATSLTRLRKFLQWYTDLTNDADDPAA